MRQKPKIILLTLTAAIAYGILLDQFTARLCPEYFTLAHPPLFPTSSPTLLAIAWGTAATAGFGLIFGALLASASQSPGLPPIPVSQLARSLAFVLLLMSAAAALAGFLGWELSRHAIISLPTSLIDTIPAPQHHRFMAVWFAHGASYLFGVPGATFLVAHTWNQRNRPAIITFLPRTRLQILRTSLVLALVCAILYARFYATR